MLHMTFFVVIFVCVCMCVRHNVEPDVEFISIPLKMHINHYVV